MAKVLTIPRVWRLTRAGEIDANATTIQQRAATFTSATPDGTVLLTRRTSDGLFHYFIAPHAANVETAAAHLAQTVAARTEELDDSVGLFDSKSIAYAEAHIGSVMGRDSQVNADISEVSRLMASMISEGEWVAAVIRKPASKEKSWHKVWIQHQLGGGGATPTHHSSSPNAIVMSLWAGSDSSTGAKNLLRQVAAAIPGFDIQIRTTGVSAIGRGALAILAGLLTFAGGVALFTSGVTVPKGAVVFLGVLAGLGLPAAIGGVLYIIGRVPSFAEKVKRLARYNLLISPRGRLLRPAAPRAQHLSKEGATVPGKDGGYPFGRGAFMTGSILPVGLVAPHAGADSGSASTKERTAPAVMREPMGPFIGTSGDAPIYLSAEDFYAGVILYGQSGSGKTRAVQSLYAWSALERVRPSGKPGFPGAENALIAFESKGEGAAAYKRWAAITGDTLLQIDFAGPGNIQLDILNIPGNAEKRARAVTNMLKYAFSDGSIQARSFDTLNIVMAGAFAITPAVAALAGISLTGSPFYYAAILLGNKGDALGVTLAGAIKDEVARLSLGLDTDLGFADDVLAALYVGKTPAQRAQLTDAPRNKVSALMAAESWWSRPKKITWETILKQKFPVVINTGITAARDQADDALVEQMSAMMMYSLYEAIKRNCSAWEEAGQSVSIFADELKLLAGSSAEVITWLRNQGRSYGVHLVFATQYPEQLSPEVKTAVMGFGTLLAFSQNNPDVIRTLISDLNLAGEEWTGADVANLPAFETIVRATAGKKRQAPFTVKIHDFWGDQDNFIQTQGYRDIPVGGNR